MKLRPILAMFPQTAKVLPSDTIVPFADPHCTGNRALYLLVCSRVHLYFQRAIKQFEPFGDKALDLIQKQCAHKSRMDKHYFHELFTGLHIRDDESATSFLKRFTYSKTTAEDATNAYTEEQLVDYVFAGLRATTKDVYKTTLQLYQLECHQGKIFSLEEVEQNFFELDEELGLDKKASCNERALTATGHRPKRGNLPKYHDHSKPKGNYKKPPHKPSFAHVAARNSIVCFKCGAPGHTAPKCPNNKTHDPRSKPSASARGNAALSTHDQESNGTAGKPELVCMARTIDIAKAFTARRIINYNEYPNMPRPRPQPIPVLNIDFTGNEITNTRQYVTLGLSIQRGEFNELLENHINDNIVPTAYMGSRNPTNDDVWIMTHD